MKISDLKREIEGLPEEADVYVYTGSGGTFVNAEWSAVATGLNEPGGAKRIIDSPVCVPQGGGPTVSPSERAVKSVAGERARLDPDLIG